MMSRSDRSAREADPPIITGTIWTCPRCGEERRRRVVPADHYDALASMIREVSDEVVLLPVSTLNAIAERAERAERGDGFQADTNSEGFSSGSVG